MPARHLAMFRICPELVASCFENDRRYAYHVISNGIPPGAEFVNAAYDFESHLFCVVLEHESFPVCDEGMPVYRLPSAIIANEEIVNAG